jgi:hypothetical protein
MNNEFEKWWNNRHYSIMQTEIPNCFKEGLKELLEEAFEAGKVCNNDAIRNDVVEKCNDVSKN